MAALFSRLLSAAAILVGVGACQNAGAAAPSGPPALNLGQAPGPGVRWIEHVRGDVYLFRDNDNIHNAMFVVTADGIIVTDPINADAVAWLESELKERFSKPVTHMLYSHFHSGHNSGGERWGEGLQVVAHEATEQHIAAGETQTALPTQSFTDEVTIHTGGKTVELTYLGKGHSDDLVAMVVRPENVAFVVDIMTPNRLPLMGSSSR